LSNTPGGKAIYPGSFDPITHGHMDILDRSLCLFSEVTIVIAGSLHKDPLLSVEERMELARQAVSDRPNVKVDVCHGLIMDFARRHQVNAVIRGLRAAGDFEYEFMMASMNKKINPKVETVFMMTSQNLYFVRSSMIKELHRYGGDIAPYVPECVAIKLKERLEKGLI
jgi:pantetheine-phosphate adenylyltransferase